MPDYKLQVGPLDAVVCSILEMISPSPMGYMGCMGSFGRLPQDGHVSLWDIRAPSHTSIAAGLEEWGNGKKNLKASLKETV